MGPAFSRRAVWRAGLVCLLAVSCVPSSVRAQDGPSADDERLAPLRLVEHVGVLVDDLTPDAESLSLRRESIQADAEERLRLGNLRVHEGAPFPPVLYFQVSVLCGSGGACATDVSASVIQDVYLLQAAPRAFQARTWSTGRILLIPRALVESRVREVVREQADLFASEVMTARQRGSQ